MFLLYYTEKEKQNEIILLPFFFPGEQFLFGARDDHLSCIMSSE